MVTRSGTNSTVDPRAVSLHRKVGSCKYLNHPRHGKVRPSVNIRRKVRGQGEHPMSEKQEGGKQRQTPAQSSIYKSERRDRMAEEQILEIEGTKKT